MYRDTETVRMQPAILTDIEICSVPFPYFISGKVFDDASAESLLRWLETDIPWQLHEGDFFEQFECNLLHLPIPTSCAHLFQQDTLNELKSRIETLLETELTDQLTIVAHKLIPGQGIGVHNDAPHHGLETHRLVVNLGRSFKDSYGGHLLFFNSNDPEDIHRIFRPIHNTAVGFAMSDKSYHAVGNVHEGVRYSIVYSFWQKGVANTMENKESEELGQYGPGYSEMAGLEDLVKFLKSTGTEDIHHSEGNLLSHLVHTYKILKRWDCPQYLCLAGLCHSIYGTEAFRTAAVSMTERQTVQETIGEEAEQVAYLYCIGSHQSLYENLSRAEPYSLRDFRDDTEIPISKQRLADLLTLDLANSLEQFPRISLNSEMLETERSIYEEAIPFLPEAAIAEMRPVYKL